MSHEHCAWEPTYLSLSLSATNAKLASRAQSLGVLELTALPTIGAERWVPWVRETDVLLVDGGDATYLCHWMRESGLAALLPSLPDLVWAGVVNDGVVEVVSEGHWKLFPA